jgi:hypothetical protein
MNLEPNQLRRRLLLRRVAAGVAASQLTPLAGAQAAPVEPAVADSRAREVLPALEPIRETMPSRFLMPSKSVACHVGDDVAVHHDGPIGTSPGFSGRRTLRYGSTTKRPSTVLRIRSTIPITWIL